MPVIAALRRLRQDCKFQASPVSEKPRVGDIMVESVPSMCKTLGLSLSIEGEKKKIKP
jgi:hypothetical protein